MGKLVSGADGLPAEEVGEWIEEKLFDVRQYVTLSHGARRKFLGPVPRAPHTSIYSAGPVRRGSGTPRNVLMARLWRLGAPLREKARRSLPCTSPTRTRSAAATVRRA